METYHGRQTNSDVISTYCGNILHIVQHCRIYAETAEDHRPKVKRDGFCTPPSPSWATVNDTQTARASFYTSTRCLTLPLLSAIAQPRKRGLSSRHHNHRMAHLPSIPLSLRHRRQNMLSLEVLSQKWTLTSPQSPIRHQSALIAMVSTDRFLPVWMFARVKKVGEDFTVHTRGGLVS
jgi:hypothetical protein